MYELANHSLCFLGCRRASKDVLSSKTVMEVLLPGRSGGPSLWGACLSDCICSLGRRVVGVATEKLQRNLCQLMGGSVGKIKTL